MEVFILMQKFEKTLVLTRRGGERTFLIKKSTAKDTAQIFALQEAVVHALPKPQLFVSLTDAELSESLDADICLSVFCEGELCAFTLMIKNRITSRHLGLYLDYETHELLETVSFDSAFVSPEFRGFSLQSLLLAEKEHIARNLGAKRAIATVSPENEASFKNLTSNGFNIIEERIMYSGVSRYIVVKIF